MKVYRIVILMTTLTVVSACGSTPNTPGTDATPISKSAPTSKSVPKVGDGFDVVDAIHEGDDIGDAKGLGTIVYNGRPLIECRRLRRTGSRIPRDVCEVNGFNGLFPSGINLGTGGESQPGYGRQ